MAAPQGAAQQPEALQARDVVAFGQEVGRVLSDGRIVGRAEPFAKVFPSSRAVKRAVGVTAWAILEDIALDARLDVEGRLVAETQVRRIADNLGLSKNTVSRHLTKLREHGFVLHEEQRDDGSGRYVTSRYVLDPSACVERFTHTPTGDDREDENRDEDRRESRLEPRPRNGDTGPRRRNCDTARAVSQSTGHGDLGQHPKRVVGRDTPPPAGDDHDLVGRLTDLGVPAGRAESLVAEHPGSRVVEVLDAVGAQQHVRSPGGWAVAALGDGWDVADAAAQKRRQKAARDRATAAAADQAEAAEHADEQRQSQDEWAAAVSAALDDEQLRRAVERLVPRLPGLGRRSVPMARSRLVAWAARVWARQPHVSLHVALRTELAEPSTQDGSPAMGTEGQLPAPPVPAVHDVVPLDDRLGPVLTDLDQHDREEGAGR